MSETKDYINQLCLAIRSIRVEELEGIANAIRGVDIDGGTIWVLGNGGSQANASHLVLHLCQHEYKAHDLMAETALMSALANDESYKEAPVSRLDKNGTSKDALIVLSGSGQSQNILAALEEAGGQGMTTIGLLGMGGGSALNLCDTALVVSGGNYGIIEDAHSAVIHMLGLLLTAG